MLLILPYTQNHKALYEHIVSLGGDGGHDLLLVGRKSQARELEDAVEEFTKVFAHVDVFAVDGEPSRNRLFSETVKWLDLVANEAPFYWFENSVPVKASWLDDLYMEYRIKRTPFLGAVEPSIEVDPATGKKFEENPRLMAASIYPADLYQRSTLVKQLCYRNAPDWNVQMRFEIRREATVSAHIQPHGGPRLTATSVITGTSDPTILEPKKEKDHARK